MGGVGRGWIRALVALGWVVGIVACRGGPPAAPPQTVVPPLAPLVRLEATANVEVRPTPPPREGRVEPVPREVLVAAGETIPLMALAYDGHGNPVPDALFRWRALDPAAGTVSPGGVFQAGTRVGSYPGALLVEARSPLLGPAGVARAEVNVTVLPAGRTRTPVRVRVAPPEVEARPGQTVFLVAHPVDEAGIPVPGVPVEWVLLDSQAGSLTPWGKFTAGPFPGVYPQALQARAGTGLLSEPVRVRILDPALAPQRVTALVFPSVAALLPGGEVTFRVLLLDEAGREVPVLSARWEVLSPQAGQIRPDGRFRAAYQAGTYPEAVRVTLLYQVGEGRGTAVARAGVVVLDTLHPPAPPDPLSLARVVLFPQRVEVYPGESATLVAMPLDGNGFPLRGLPIEWRLASPDIGEITPSGKVTAGLTPGVYPDAIRAVVRAPHPQGERVLEGRATLVIRGPLARLTVTPSTVTVTPGRKVRFIAEGYDAFGTYLPGLRLRWEVVDPRAGTITPDGLFTAGSAPGWYPGAVRVEALQRYPPR